MEIAPLCLYLVDWASSLGFTLPSDSGEKLSLGEHLTFSFLFYRKGHNPSWFVTLPNTKSLLVSKCKIYVICPEIVRHSSKEPLSMWVGLKLWINRKKGSILTSLNRIQKSTRKIMSRYHQVREKVATCLRGDNPVVSDRVSQHGSRDHAGHFT